MSSVVFEEAPAEALAAISLRTLFPADLFPQPRVGRAGWIRAQRLIDPTSPALERLLQHWQRQSASVDSREPATRFLSDYLRAVAFSPLAAYLLEARVPDVRSANLWVRLDQHPAITSIAFQQLRCATLAGDARTPPPDQTPLRDYLWRWLIEDHLLGLMARLQEQAGLSLATQRGLVADTLAQIFLRIGRLTHTQPYCQHEATAFLSHPDWPLPQMCEVRPGTLVVVRRACCFKYTCPGRARCALCPGRSAAEQAQHLDGWAHTL